MARLTISEETRTYLLRVIERALANTHQADDELADAILAKLSNSLREMVASSKRHLVIDNQNGGAL